MKATKRAPFNASYVAPCAKNPRDCGCRIHNYGCHPDCDEGVCVEECPRRAETERYYRGLYGGMSREQLKACDPRPMTDGRREEYEQELRDAGRGHLVRR